MQNNRGISRSVEQIDFQARQVTYWKTRSLCMKRRFTFIFVLLILMLAVQLPLVVNAEDNVTLTIAVVNNPDQRKLLQLSDQFHAAYPNINLSFVMLPENELRARVTTDITTGTGSFDIVQVGTYDTPIFAEN